MSVVSILQGLYGQTGNKYINIPAGAFTAEFGSGPVQDAIAQLLSGQLQVGSATNNITFVIDVPNDKVTITGTGSLPPLDSINVSVVFQAKSGGVSMDLNATVTSNWTLSQAWPSHLNVFPFNALTITGGSLTLNVAPGASDVQLTASVSSSFSGQTLSNTAADGLFVAEYKNSALTFGGGFLVTGTWSPFSSSGGLNLPSRFQNVFDDSFELGLFFATLEIDDLSAFDNLKGSGKLFFLPDKIQSGLTFLAGMQMAGDASVLGTLFTGKPTLQFTAFKGDSEIELSAALKDVTLGTFTFNSVELDWKSSGADSGEIDLNLVTVINSAAANMNNLGVCGTGTLSYGTQDSATFEVQVGKCGDGTNGWADPFGIPDLTIDDFGVAFKLVADPEEVAVDLGGQFTLGTDQPKPVVVTVAAGVALDADLPAPDGLVFEISGTSPGTQVSLSDVIDDVASVFGKSFPQGTLLDDVQIEEIEIAVVQSPFSFGGQTWNPLISFVGDITVFGFNIDAMLTFNTKASPPYLQACGTFNQNGGPIVVSVAGVTLLKLSDVTGTKGPAMCLDTLALTSTSTFCGGACNAVSPGGSGYFLVLDAQTSILGLASASVFAKVATTAFDFDVKLNLFGVLGAELQCVFDPKQGDFFGAAEFSIGDKPGDTVSFPNSITLDIGPFSVNIPLPTIEFAVCVAAGTFAPSGVSCAGWTPPASGPFFHFGLDFQLGSIDFGIDVTIDESTFSSIATAFEDFGKFLLDWLKDVANWGKELLLKLLYWIGAAFEDAVKAVAEALKVAVEEIADLAKDVWNALEQACSESTADGLLA
jgi:hypothetical protein